MTRLGGSAQHRIGSLAQVVDSEVVVAPTEVRDPEVLGLLDALTAELARSGYTAQETFGYSAEQLEQSAVHLVGARQYGKLAGIGGVELQDGHFAELKRFFVEPEYRGTGVADAIMKALLAYCISHDIRVVRLETGNRQLSARRFYGRHGFLEVPRFPPYTASQTSICMQRVL